MCSIEVSCVQSFVFEFDKFDIHPKRYACIVCCCQSGCMLRAENISLCFSKWFKVVWLKEVWDTSYSNWCLQNSRTKNSKSVYKILWSPRLRDWIISWNACWFCFTNYCHWILIQFSWIRMNRCQLDSAARGDLLPLSWYYCKFRAKFWFYHIIFKCLESFSNSMTFLKFLSIWIIFCLSQFVDAHKLIHQIQARFIDWRFLHIFTDQIIL